MIHFELGSAAIAPLQENNIARSYYTRSLQQAFKLVDANYDYVHTYDERRLQIWDKLNIAVSECLAPNWDGQGAKPCTETTVANARMFLLILPRNVSLPEIDVDPDGEISFRWSSRKHHRFTMSLGANKMLSYAGRKGSHKWYGVVPLEDKLPDELLSEITSVLI